MKPKLNIKFFKKTNEIFPPTKKYIVIGICGSEGSHMHQAILRLAEHLFINSNCLDFRFLKTESRVLKAVASGAIDRGVIIFKKNANPVLKNKALEIITRFEMEIYQFAIIKNYC